jgi:outer membrane protein assembly factor BamE (lipoprotein component of BamABCDE complex)
MAGCSTIHIGSEFDLNAFSQQVQHGVTTKSQIRAWLGAPAGTGVSIDTKGIQFEEWLYYYGHGKLPAMKNVSLKTLQVKFDQAGVVRGYNWSDSQ